jgi:hypothetical protein
VEPALANTTNSNWVPLFASTLTFSPGNYVVASGDTYIARNGTSTELQSPQPSLANTSGNGWVPMWAAGKGFSPGNFVYDGTLYFIAHPDITSAKLDTQPERNTTELGSWVPIWMLNEQFAAGNFVRDEQKYYFAATADGISATQPVNPAMSAIGWVPVWLGDRMYSKGEVVQHTNQSTRSLERGLWVSDEDGNGDTPGPGTKWSPLGAPQTPQRIPRILSFYNHLKYIRVENRETSVTSYFSKSNLTFEADANNSFFLKSDTLHTKYLFEDVERPETQHVNVLMETFKSWIDDSTQLPISDVYLSDSTSTLLEVKTFYDKDPLRISELLLGDSSSHFDGGMNAVTMDIGNTATSRAVRQTKLYTAMISNNNTFSIVSSTILVDPSAPNWCARVGCFDDNIDAVSSGNGVFFQYRTGDVNSPWSLVLRSNITGAQVDTEVPQGMWNMDTLDGLGPSKVVLTAGTETTFIFAMKGDMIHAGIMDQGRFIYVHKFSNVRMGCTSLPLRWELLRPNPDAIDNGIGSLIQSCASVMIRGTIQTPIITRSMAIHRLHHVTRANSPQPMFSLRLRPATNRARIQPRRLRIQNLEEGMAKWSVVINPAVVNATFVDVGADSFAQFSDTDHTVSDGVIVASGYVADTSEQTIDLDSRALFLCADIVGIPDILTLVVNYMRGVVSLSASVEWAEMLT